MRNVEQKKSLKDKIEHMNEKRKIKKRSKDQTENMNEERKKKKRIMLIMFIFGYKGSER